MSNLAYSNGNDLSVPDTSLETNNSHFNENTGVNGKSITTIMRTIGACAVLASLSLFLLEGWTEGNDLFRYIKLLSLTGLITGAGIFLSFIFKEVKGARVFFGLGLVATVANFMILGALTYSIVQFDGALGDYPSMLKWQTINIGTFIPMAIGAFALLSFLSYFSFSIFARGDAKRLTAVFIALNCLFVIPVRETLYASVLAAIALAIASSITAKAVREQTLALTRESKAALACLFLPGTLIVARALGLYAVDELMLVTIFGLIYYAARTFGGNSDVDLKSKAIDCTRFIAGLGFSLSLVALLPYHFDGFYVLAFSLLIMACMYDMSSANIDANLNKALAKHKLILISAFAVVLILTNVVTTLDTSSMLVSISCLMTMLMLLALTMQISNSADDLRAAKLMSILAASGIGLLTLVRLVDQFNVGSWILFAGGGVALILLASMVERSGWLLRSDSSNPTS